MLSPEQNQLLTEAARDTRAGTLYRRHWIPVARSADLPVRGGPPVRRRLLGEDLVLFRAGDGSVGLLSEWCPHRGASLYFGRNEPASTPTGAGLRCVYHGWKFDTGGACVDMPNEPAESSFRTRVRARAAYPCIELSGIVFAHLGDPEHRPDPPELPWTMLPADHVYASVRLQLCNSIQAFEGAVDASHVGVLHGDIGLWDVGNEFSRIRTGIVDTSPRFFVAHTDFGLTIGARRRYEGGQAYWRFTQVALPWYVVLSGEPDSPISGHAWVPVDDHRCYTWTFSYRTDRPLEPQERALWEAGKGLHAPLVPGTLTPTMNRDNDYLINRDLQASMTSMTGISGVGLQDAAVQENMGPSMDPAFDGVGARVDRSTERLGSADAGVIATRRLLLAAATALEKDPGLHSPGEISADQRQVRAYPSVVVDEAVEWDEARRRAEAATG